MLFLIGLFLGWLLGLATPPFYKWIVSVVTKKNSVNVLIFAVLSVALMSCGTTTGDPTVDNIGFSEAWKHVAGFTSYWVWLILAAIPLIVYIGYLIVNGNAVPNHWIIFALLALFLFAMLMPPGECAANTTVEQAARGVYIR